MEKNNRRKSRRQVDSSWRDEFVNELNLFDCYDQVLPEWVLAYRENMLNSVSSCMIKLAHELQAKCIPFKLFCPIIFNDKKIRFIDLLVGCVDVAVVNAYVGDCPVNSPYYHKSQRILDIESVGFRCLSMANNKISDVVDEIMFMIDVKRDRLRQKKQQQQNCVSAAAV
jgi:hypothetical protein